MLKAKRLVAMLLTILMTVSLCTVITLADSGNSFEETYVDPTGTIQSSAILVDPKVSKKEDGAEHVAEWDGKFYTFIVGQNVFPTYAKARDAVSLGGQVLLGNGTFGEIDLDRPMQVFGINWNKNPNVVNPEDPTQLWTLNPEWNEKSSVVTNVIIRAGGISNVGVYGITISGRFYDIYRQVSTTKTVLTVENVLLKQNADVLTKYYTESGTGRTGTNNNYVFMLYNHNAANNTQSGKFNKDETIFRNLRIDVNSLATPCNRLMDEKVSPKITFDGCYIDTEAWASNKNIPTSPSQIGWWMKWSDYVTDASINIVNSCITGSKGDLFHFEGFNKANVGFFEGQYTEINICNNLFYNTSSNPFRIYANSFSKVNFNGNYVVSTAAGKNNTIINWNNAGGDEMGDVISMRDNTFIGYSGYTNTSATAKNPVDMTGTFIANVALSPSWINATSTLKPSGNVKYDYYWFDAKRTNSSNAIPAFDIADAVVDKENMTISIDLSGKGIEKYTPAVSSSDSGFNYGIYASDAEFSNAADYKSLEPINECVLKNYTNYFLFVAKSYDGNLGDVYKLTITKPANDDVAVNGIIVADPAVEGTDYSVVNNGLVYDINVNREFDAVEFILDTDNEAVAYDVETEEVINTANFGRYRFENLELLKTKTVKFVVSNGDSKEYYYINITRTLNDKCELIWVDDSVTVNGNNLSAVVDGSATSFEFFTEISIGAIAYVWKDSTVFAADEFGMFTVTGLKTGENVFKFAVKAENGVNETVYNLTITKPKNTECELLGVEGAQLVNGIYTVTTLDAFTINPTVSTGATYKFYSDPNCTKEIGNTVNAGTVVYVKVTSEDGNNVSHTYRIDVNKSEEGIAVEGATLANDVFTVKAADNAKTAELKVTAVGAATYTLYADKKLSKECGATVALDQGETNVYAVVKYSNNTTKTFTIKVISNRTAVAYADAANIPAWAKAYVDKLNNSGLGILKGDDKGNFNPTNNMTRYEIAAVAVRILGVDATQYAGVTLSYTDGIAKWAENYVKAVTALGIMSGSNDKDGKLVFNGTATATRAQLAKIIVEIALLDSGAAANAEAYYAANKAAVDAKYASYAFADEASIQNWAKTYVKLSVYDGYFTGSNTNGQNYFNANNNIMRSEIAAVVERYLGL